MPNTATNRRNYHCSKFWLHFMSLQKAAHVLLWRRCRIMQEVRLHHSADHFCPLLSKNKFSKPFLGLMEASYEILELRSIGFMQTAEWIHLQAKGLIQKRGTFLFPLLSVFKILNVDASFCTFCSFF